MKNLSRLARIVCVVCVHSLCQSRAYYHSDGPKSGFISVDNGAYTKHGARAVQRRYFSITRRNNGNVVDTHFDILKNTPYLLHTQKAATNALPSPTPTDKPMEVEIKEIGSKREYGGGSNDNHNVEHGLGGHAGLSAPDFMNLNKDITYKTAFQNGQEIYSKSNFVAMNTNKKTDNKLVELMHSREHTYVRRPNYQRERILIRNKDSTIGSLKNNHTRQGNRLQKAEYRKRHTTPESDMLKRSVTVGEAIRKYIVGRDKNFNVERQSKDYSRIGSHELAGAAYSPYAIFYRMQSVPENDNDNETYSAMDQPGDEVANSKKKRSSSEFDSSLAPKMNEASLTRPRIMHKKLKYIAAYRVTGYM